MGDEILKKLVYLILGILLINLVFGYQECKPVMQPQDIIGYCQITSTWNYTPPCNSYQLNVYNESGYNVINYTYQDYGTTGLCFTLWNFTTIGSYNGIVNNADTTNIRIEGDTQMMSFTVIFFLALFNIGIFLIPIFVRRFTDSQASDYIIRHLFWMGGCLFLWFNFTILMQMSSTAGLGITEQLWGYWWVMTLIVACIIFILVYVTTVGAIKLSNEANMQQRMGLNE